MQALINNILMRAAAQAGSTFVARWGVVTGYDPSSYAIKATIQPEDVETGFIPLLSPWVGPQWGAFFGPAEGSQVLILFQEGSDQTPIAALFAFSAAMPPVAVPSGEMLLQHASGSLLHLDNSGNVTLTAAQAATINAPAGLTINAPTTINGNTATHGTLTNNGTNVGGTHTHPVTNVQTGTSTIESGVPQ